MSGPLTGLTVLEFSQYLAGPYAGLRLADLGARVIKIERPGSGDAGRGLATMNRFVDGDSLAFHTINRNKESFTADLKNAQDVEAVHRLLATADVMTHNFRPGVMERLGLDVGAVAERHPHIVYGDVTGYGSSGPWRDKPGQDLLAQARSGVLWLSGDAGDPPTPFGLATADMICGAHLAQGILAALVQRGRTGHGTHVSVSLLESLLDLQFEALTTFLNDGHQPPARAAWRNAHPYLAAPYGIYSTADGYLALAMGQLDRLAQLLESTELAAVVSDDAAAFDRRDEIKAVIAGILVRRDTAAWLERLEAADFWCADVFTYGTLLEQSGYQVLEMEQTVERPNGARVRTLRCPIRIDGERLTSSKAAPVLGSANATIERELDDG